MDKQLIERIALEVGYTFEVNGFAFIPDGEVKAYATRFLARIDAERGKDAVAWLHESRREADVITTAVKNVWGGVAVGNMAAYSIPLFLSPTPTIPKGMVMIDKKLLSTTIELTKEASETEFNRQPLSDELYGISLMLAAAQGERNAD